jgi:hypothetical protein
MKKRIAALLMGSVLVLPLAACDLDESEAASPSPLEGAPGPESPPPDIGPDGTFIPPEVSPELPLPES